MLNLKNSFFFGGGGGGAAFLVGNLKRAWILPVVGVGVLRREPKKCDVAAAAVAMALEEELSGSEWAKWEMNIYKIV